MSNDEVTMSHDDISAATDDLFDGIDTASEITEQTGVVSEFTMEKEAANQVATGVEEIKEETMVGGEAGEKAASAKLSPEDLKARAQQMAGQAKAVSSRVINSAKSYEQVRSSLPSTHVSMCHFWIDRSFLERFFVPRLIPSILYADVNSHNLFSTSLLVLQEHNLVDKVKGKVQQVKGFVAGKVSACTSPGVKTGEGEATTDVVDDVKE